MWFKNRRAKWRKHKREQHDLSGRAPDSQRLSSHENNDDEDDIIVTDDETSPPTSPMISSSQNLSTNHQIQKLLTPHHKTYKIAENIIENNNNSADSVPPASTIPKP